MAHRKSVWRAGAVALLAAFLAACAPTMRMAPFTAAALEVARFEADRFISFDGEALAANQWVPQDKPWAVVLALHGINSSAPVFDAFGRWMAARGVATFAYDVRGFGRSRFRGFWPGQQLMAEDARAALAALRRRYPDTPVSIMGGSLGAAQAVLALTPPNQAQPDRLILVAPGVMGWDYLPPGYAPLLRAAAITAPFVQMAPTPQMEEASPITNNPETLAANASDPLRIRQTRLDVLAGAVDLMDEAAQSLPKVRAPVAFLYGAKDAVIDQRALADAAARLPKGAQVAVYPRGYHLLLRDLDAETVYADILSFLRAPGQPLPSKWAAPGVDAKAEAAQ